jgi:ABC-type branched-subunit amino acid transport system substrate-binding protein
MKAKLTLISAFLFVITSLVFSGGVSANASSSSSVYKINTTNCPSSATQPITGTLTLGVSGPLSGPIAPFVDAYVQGIKDRYAYQNAQGGINGVQLAVTAEDDQFNPAMTKSNVDGWIQSGSVQAVTTFGSGALAAVAADQNLACLPMLLPSASADQYRNIKEYPWTTQFLPSNSVEESAEVKLIQDTFPHDKIITVAIAEDMTGSGAAYLAGMEAAVKGTNVRIKAIVPFTVPATAAITLKKDRADAVFGALVVPECVQLTEAMARVGYKPKLTVQASNCGSAALMFTPAGGAANGQKLVFWEKDPGNPLYANDPGWKGYVADATSVDPTAAVDNTYYETGYMTADMEVNSYMTAAKSSMGLTRAGIMQAARNQNYQEPLFINGLRWIMNAKEAYGIMKLQPLVYSSKTKSFHYDGSIINACPQILGAKNCTDGL